MYRIDYLPLNELYVTSPFGLRNYKNMKWHNGIDLRAKIGTAVYAVSDGIVKVAKINAGDINTGYGKYVVVEHNDFCSLYAHLDFYIVKVGQKVKAGQLIGYSGNTGDSEGPHLHFEIRLGNYDLFWTKCPSDATIYMYCINPWPLMEVALKAQIMTQEEAIEIVSRQAKLEDKTIDYLANDYRWGNDLIIKLAKAML